MANTEDQDTLLEGMNLAVLSQNGSIAVWSDERKKDFVETFASRVLVARYLLERTAQLIFHRASERSFVSQRHAAQVERATGVHPTQNGEYEILRRLQGNGYHRTVGGRQVEELDRIAGERAQAVLGNLPPLRAAVAVIDADTAKLIDARERATERLDELRKLFEDLSEEIDMGDLDQKMSIGDFRRMVKERVKRRQATAQEMQEVGVEGSQLEVTIAKRLYKGLPGLSEAVVEIVCEHIERATALDATNRRVAEQVQFGDSEAALELLRTFEKDEVKISSAVAEKFAKAMDALRASVRTQRPARKGKKS